MAFPGYGFWLLMDAWARMTNLSSLHFTASVKSKIPNLWAMSRQFLIQTFYERKSDARLSIETATSQNRLVPTFPM